MMTAGSALSDLKHRRKEWAPWLAVVEEILRETASPKWDATVPAGIRPVAEAVPLLAGATIPLQATSVRRLLQRLIRVAALSETPKMASLGAVRLADVDMVTLFTASLCHDSDRITETAAAAGADAEALQAVVALVPVPFLQACNRRWRLSIPVSWIEGYCPICGSWPAFAEVRGIERSRYFRCGRCGAEWHAQPLSCPYCAMADHHELVALVPEKQDAHAVIDACKRCLGYVKTFTTLQGCPPGEVMVEDLASVALDVAALEQGYTRPRDPGCPLDVKATDRTS
jgi:FdhE protein